ncbi:F-box protein CPR30-like protein isoform X1 [Tanacetum coccineum]
MDVPDVMEEILIRSSVQDLVPWKRVCKSWYSLISSHRFAKLHLKKTCNNNDTNKELGVGHVRIAVTSFWDLPDESLSLYDIRNWKVVGSCNGLVCLTPLPDDVLVLVNNPWTGETRKLPLPPLVYEKNTSPWDVCLSFGYD